MGFVKDTNKILEGIDQLFHPVGKEPFSRFFLKTMAVPAAAVDGSAPEIVHDDRTGFLIADGDAGTASMRLHALVEMTQCEWSSVEKFLRRSLIF